MPDYFQFEMTASPPKLRPKAAANLPTGKSKMREAALAAPAATRAPSH